MQTNNKLREALEYVIQWREDCIDEEGADNVDDMMAVVNAALAEPIRNCDVGTADEQLPRFVAAWESANRSFIDRRSMMLLSVFSRWVQLPYKAEQKGKNQ